MKTDIPLKRDIVLVGGGHAHVEVLRQFAMQPQPGSRLTLIARDVNTPYSGMLPGYLSGHYEFEECHIDLGPLCRKVGARLINTAARGIDLAAGTLIFDDRPAVPFDLLSVNTGSTPQTSAIANAERAIPIKPVNAFLDRWQAVEQRILDADGSVRFNLVVIGGGAGGVEVSLCLQHRLEQHGLSADTFKISLVTDTRELLPQHSTAVRTRMLRALQETGIEVHTGHSVTEIGETTLHCEPALELRCDQAIIITSAGPPAWLSDSGLALDEHGFVQVSQTLQSVSHPQILAAGDAASFKHTPLLKNGVYAVRQGPVLAENLRALAAERQPRPFRPQTRTLALISTGSKNAVMSYGSLAVEGEWVWRLKDTIDKRWMQRYQDLPGMNSDEPMRCGGCGAKVPASVLHNVLSELRRDDPDDVPIGLNHPDDAAVTIPPPGQVSLQTVDQFRGFIEDLYLFGRIGVNHCLSDIYGMGAKPKHALAIVTLPYAAEAKMEQDLRELLTGAMEALDEAGVTLIGGHTGEGGEVMFGLSVTGFADRNALLHKSGLREGDELVLTKPLGTGTLLAGDMRGLARSEWVQDAVDSMLLSNGPAADILLEHSASACTDITGFGLLGHLGEMLKASDVHAQIDVGAVPVMSGARELLANGVASTLHPANEAHAHVLTNPAGLSNGAAILFDPQTSGGLLAGIPRTRVDAALAALNAAGYEQSAIIGTISAGKPGRATFATS